MSLALLFHYLMLNMFRMLIHPSSGGCDLFVELFHGLYCSVRIEVFALQKSLSLQSNTAHEITQQISRKLLRMDVLTSETCWTLSNEIIKHVTSSWSLFIQLLYLMYPMRKKKNVFISLLCSNTIFTRSLSSKPINKFGSFHKLFVYDPHFLACPVPTYPQFMFFSLCVKDQEQRVVIYKWVAMLLFQFWPLSHSFYTSFSVTHNFFVFIIVIIIIITIISMYRCVLTWY